MPKHRAVKFPVDERNDNVERLAHYAAAIAVDEKTTGPAVKRRNDENQTKHRRAEQLYGGHLVRSGAAMVENQQTTAFNQIHKPSAMAQKHHETLSVWKT